MINRGLKITAIAVGIACVFGSVGATLAGTISGPVAQSVDPMSQVNNGSVDLVRDGRGDWVGGGGKSGGGGGGGRPGGGGNWSGKSGGGGNWSGKPGGGGKWSGKPGGGGKWSGNPGGGGNWNGKPGGGGKPGGHHHRHRRNFSSGFYVWPDYYDYDYGYSYDYSYDSCYRQCRYYHGPGYCRYNWRRYCD